MEELSVLYILSIERIFLQVRFNIIQFQKGIIVRKLVLNS